MFTVTFVVRFSVHLVQTKSENDTFSPVLRQNLLEIQNNDVCWIKCVDIFTSQELTKSFENSQNSSRNSSVEENNLLQEDKVPMPVSDCNGLTS